LSNFKTLAKKVNGPPESGEKHPVDHLFTGALAHAQLSWPEKLPLPGGGIVIKL
jgi:hypothetical protein